MKTILISALLFSGACVYASDASDASWFMGIGQDVTETKNMKAKNAAWTFPSAEGAVAIEGGKLVFDLDDADTVKLTPDASAAPDTNTVVKLSINTTIASVDTLPEKGVMSDAQTALAICDGFFNAWNGNAWQQLAAATEIDGEVNLSVCLSYQDMNVNPVRKVTFAINGSPLGNAVTLTGEATAKKNTLESIVCKGAATIASINGSVMLGVAKANETKFGTVGEAIDEAKKLGEGEKNVVLLRDTTEVVTDPATGITIDFNGKVAGSGDETTEACGQDSSGKIVYQPTATVMANVTGGGGQALTADLAKLRVFLAENNIAAYRAKPADANAITTALADSGANNLALWQSYALGIASSTVLKLRAVPNGGKISIPAIDVANYSGDYGISYAINNTSFSDPANVAIPLATGEYDVKIVLSPKGN